MKKILIVDDEETILQILSRTFANECHQVDTAKTLDAAIGLIESNDYDTVLTDLRLSNNSGREGLQLLERAKKLRPGCRVILITGNGTETIKKEFFAGGGDLYLEKPVDLKILHDNV